MMRAKEGELGVVTFYCGTLFQLGFLMPRRNGNRRERSG
jgi:hypothetical protein